MNRRTFLLGAAPAALARAAPSGPDFRLADVTAAAGIQFHHSSGAFGAKRLPVTLGSGCAFFDYDGDGWLDILLVNGMNWSDHRGERTTMRLYRNNRSGTFTDVTARAGLAVEMYGMGVAIGDYNNDGFPDLLVTAVGQNRLFQNDGKGHFLDVTEKAGLGGRTAFSTSAMWFDFDRDGLLDLVVQLRQVVCGPRRLLQRGWQAQVVLHSGSLSRRNLLAVPNRGNGTFEMSPQSGVFDSTSKSLGVPCSISIVTAGRPDDCQRHAAKQVVS